MLALGIPGLETPTDPGTAYSLGDIGREPLEVKFLRKMGCEGGVKQITFHRVLNADGG